MEDNNNAMNEKKRPCEWVNCYKLKIYMLSIHIVRGDIVTFLRIQIKKLKLWFDFFYTKNIRTLSNFEFDFSNFVSSLGENFFTYVENNNYIIWFSNFTVVSELFVMQIV